MKSSVQDIKGYEGLYQIDSDGKVFSKVTNKEKTKELSKNGYERVSLWKEGKGKHYLVHRLVAMAFIPNPNNYGMVNHIDGNKQNNNVNNLEWCNASHNMRHAFDNYLINSKTTKVIQYSKDFEFIKVWDSITEACVALNINHSNIVTVCKGNTNRKYAGGYIWRYLDENL